jgi:hypothetical protein
MVIFVRLMFGQIWELTNHKRRLLDLEEDDGLSELL